MELYGDLYDDVRGGFMSSFRFIAMTPYFVEDQRLFDVRSATVMKTLKEMGLFTIEDVKRHELVMELCKEKHFPERRFRFLADWDPDALARPTSYNSYNWLPLHYA